MLEVLVSTWRLSLGGSRLSGVTGLQVCLLSPHDAVCRFHCRPFGWLLPREFQRAQVTP